MAYPLRDVPLAWARVRILHHAAEAKTFGVGTMRALGRHGCALGPGTPCPLPSRLRAEGRLPLRSEAVAGTVREYGAIARPGRAALAAIRPELTEPAAEAPPSAERVAARRSVRRTGG